MVKRFLGWCAVMMVAWVCSTPASASEVTVWHTWRGTELEALESLAGQFGEETGINVRLVDVPFGAFDSKVETAIPRGNGPDVFISAHSNLGKWSKMGLMRPVDAELGAHLPATVGALSHDDRSWGYPLAYKSLVLLYDPSKISTPPRTVEDLVAQAKGQTSDGAYGLAWQAAEPYFLGPFLHGYGAVAMTPEGEVDLAAEGHAEAYELVRRLAQDEGIAPQQPTAELITRLYNEGRVSMVISGPWFLSEVERPVAAAPLPLVNETGLPLRPYLTVEAAFVAEQASNPEGAARFASFLSGSRGAAVRQSVGRQAVSFAQMVPSDPLLLALAEQAKVAVPMPSDPEMSSVFEAQARSLRAVIRGAATPEAAAEAASTYHRILSRPPPPATSPWPYVGVLMLALLGLVAWACSPLLDPAERARVRAHAWDYAWIAPAGLAMSALVVLPFVTGASVSLLAHHRGEWSFVGLANFASILLSEDWAITSPLSFFSTLVVTILWTVSNLALHVGLGVILALVLREPWVRMKTLWRVLLIIPWAVPSYITALIWKGMFHAQYGAINGLLGVVAGHTVELDWFGSFASAFCANLATNTWLGFPFMMVVTLGALQSIPRDLEEAALVDGAGYFFRFRHVVWPMLKPALLPAIILGSVWTFNMFNVVYLVSAGEPNSSTEILISDAYRWAFSRGNRYGYAAAYAVIIFGVLLAYSRGANKLVGQKVL